MFAEIVLGAARIEMRWIPPGRFMMGSPVEERGRFDNEIQHEVTLTRGFWLGATPVTQRQWEAVMGDRPSRFEGAENPVEQVNWDATQRFCQKLDEMLGGAGCRLPTEVEWEYACRAGTASAFNNGSECTVPAGEDPALEQLGWYTQNSDETTHPVRQKACNAWGLYDMHGNVWEWCSDWYGEYRPEPQTNPCGPRDGEFRVFRGGCWGSDARYCRSAYRDWDLPGIPWYLLGFRLAAGQQPEKKEPERSEG